MNGWVYGIVNLVNDKIYIGQTVQDVALRIKQHKWELRSNKHTNLHLQRAYDKYGEDNFFFAPLLECASDKLDYYEQEYIQKFKALDKNYGYNLETGGNKNKKLAKSTKKLMSEGMMGEKNPMFGKSLSNEECLRLSKNKNSTGYFRVTKKPDKRSEQGFTWNYRCYIDGKRQSICNRDIEELKSKVLEKGWLWVDFSKEGLIEL